MNQISLMKAPVDFGRHDQNSVKAIITMPADPPPPTGAQALPCAKVSYLPASINWNDGVEQWGLND
jgi:hypothetical protein